MVPPGDRWIKESIRQREKGLLRRPLFFRVRPWSWRAPVGCRRGRSQARRRGPVQCSGPGCPGLSRGNRRPRRARWRAPPGWRALLPPGVLPGVHQPRGCRGSPARRVSPATPPAAGSFFARSRRTFFPPGAERRRPAPRGRCVFSTRSVPSRAFLESRGSPGRSGGGRAPQRGRSPHQPGLRVGAGFFLK